MTLKKEQTYIDFGVRDQASQNYISLFPEEMIVSLLDAFIINRPMSGAVGGDGFWVHQTSDHLYIAIFDCMGHGHLASMMTRVYTQTLQKVIVQDKVQDPGTVLMNLHEGIGAKFKHKTNLLVGTGADVAILRINLEFRQIEFAGAKLDMLYVQNGEIRVAKASRMQIGDQWEYDRKYATESIALGKEGWCNFYLSSDGFRDQPGGVDGKKMGSKRMVELITSNCGHPMVQQKKNLQKFIAEWTGSQSQVDDMLIIGFAL